jgi:two-component system response regulator DevR
VETALWSNESDGCVLIQPITDRLDWMRSDSSTELVRVFLLTENRLLRDALLRVLRNKEDLLAVGAISFSPSALDQVAAMCPDVVLFDTPSLALAGPRLVSRILKVAENRRAIMIGMEEDEETFLRAVGEGVVGYVLKDASAVEVVRAIREVAAGGGVCPPRFTFSLFQCAARDVCFSFRPRQEGIFGLSPREQELVKLIGSRFSNKEIANKLNLSEYTVKNHVHRILRKVGAKGRFDITERCQSEHTLAVSPTAQVF